MVFCKTDLVIGITETCKYKTIFLKGVFFADRVGDTELDDEITDCALVEHQYSKGYIRLREYLERKRGCGRRGNLYGQ